MENWVTFFALVLTYCLIQVMFWVKKRVTKVIPIQNLPTKHYFFPKNIENFTKNLKKLRQKPPPVFV